MAELVAAEIEPIPGRVAAAARALQRLGFRVLHTGATISVEAPATLWEEMFRVPFEPRRGAGPELGGEGVSPEHTEAVSIPPELEELVRDVAFVPPPEFF